MVAAVPADVSRLFGLYRLLDVGGLSGPALLVRALSLADVLAAYLGGRQPARHPARVARRMAGVDTEVSLRDTCAPDPLGAGRISIHLLLLSRSLLQSLLGRPARMRRRRTSPQISRRAKIPARNAEHT